MERKYKDSGIEWIGKIPETWEVSQLSNLFKEHSKRNIGIQETNLLSLSYGSIIRKNINDNGGLLPESFEGYNIVEKDDIVFRLTDLQNDKRSLRTGLVKERGIITSAYVTVRKRDYKNSSSYFHYLFHSCDECKIFYGLGAGVRQGMNFQDLKKLGIVLPPLSEQQRIADYLDEKCVEIDSLIALQEQMIEKLKAYKQSVITEAVTKGLDPNAKLVPSGIDWIGEIPEGWSLAKMDYICSVITDFVASGSFESLRVNVPYLDSPDYAMLVRTADLSGTAKSDKRVYISKHSYDFLKNSNLFGGEIVLPNIGASVGDVYIVPNSLYSKMSLGPNSIMFKTIYYDMYYYYYFLGEPGRRSVINMCQATAQPKFNKTQLRGLQVVLPPLEEQKRIVEFVDSKCSDIDRLIALKQQKIESLKDYKKSVIYEAVTGKTEIE